jgi:hypothetical protein
MLGRVRVRRKGSIRNPSRLLCCSGSPLPVFPMLVIEHPSRGQDLRLGVCPSLCRGWVVTNRLADAADDGPKHL